MSKYINSEISQHIMRLIQLGANVQVVSGKMVYVKYILDNDVEVAYVYHINKHKKYFLDRIKPYPLPLKEFDSAKDVINTIELDIKQYTNALQSRNINEFISINTNLHNTIKAFEELFLNYNIPKEQISEIDKNLQNIESIIQNAKQQCTKIFIKSQTE